MSSSSEAKPAGRRGHSCVLTGDGTFLLFGGQVCVCLYVYTTSFTASFNTSYLLYYRWHVAPLWWPGVRLPICLYYQLYYELYHWFYCLHVYTTHLLQESIHKPPDSYMHIYLYTHTYDLCICMCVYIII